MARRPRHFRLQPGAWRPPMTSRRPAVAAGSGARGRSRPPAPPGVIPVFTVPPRGPAVGVCRGRRPVPWAADLLSPRRTPCPCAARVHSRKCNRRSAGRPWPGRPGCRRGRQSAAEASAQAPPRSATSSECRTAPGPPRPGAVRAGWTGSLWTQWGQCQRPQPGPGEGQDREGAVWCLSRADSEPVPPAGEAAGAADCRQRSAPSKEGSSR